MNLTRMGGVAALLLAAAYVVGIGLSVTVLDTSGITDAVEEVAFLVGHQAIMAIWILFIYVVFGVLLVVLALALHGLLRAGAPELAQTGTVFGLIWATLLIASGMVYKVGLQAVAGLYPQDPTAAAALMAAVTVVHEGVGGVNEIPGGLWTLLISAAALQAGRFPRALNLLGLLIGVAGLLTVVPAIFNVAVAIFGLSSIVWFIWLGVVLLRGSAFAAARAPELKHA